MPSTEQIGHRHHGGRLAATPSPRVEPPGAATQPLAVPAVETARQLALDHLREWEKSRVRLEDPSDHEALHDFRVALRRLRSVVRAFRPVLDGRVAGKLRRRLNRLADATSESRDLEVQRAWIESQLERLSARQKSGAKWMISIIQEREAEAGHAFRRKVEKRFTPLVMRLREALSEPEGAAPAAGATAAASTGVILGQAVHQLTTTLEARLAAVHSISDDTEIHAARIRVKRLRYLLEPFRKELAGAPEVIARLKQLQDLLGDLHDAHRIADRLREAHRAGVAGRADQLYGELLFSSKRGTGGRKIPDVRLGMVALARLLAARAEELYQQLDVDWLHGDGARELVRQLRAIGQAATATGTPGVEIERKYLLRAVPPHALAFPRDEIEQGWIPGTRLMERVRRTRGAEGDRWFRTVKSGQGLARLEIEESTTEAIFDALWPLTAGCRVTKRRYQVPEGDLTWVIDEFTDRDLVLAEVELPSEDTPATPPSWLAEHLVREVTGESAYLNRVLAR